MPRKNPRKGTIARGNAAQAAAAIHLEMQNYTVHVAVRSRHHNNDILGVFDILAVKDMEPPRFIQVTDITNEVSKGNVYHRKRKVESVSMHVMALHEIDAEPRYTPGCSVEVWGINMKEKKATAWYYMRDENDKKYWDKSDPFDLEVD